MKRSKFTDEQILAIVKEGEAGRKVADLCRANGIPEQTHYRWKAKFGAWSSLRCSRLRLDPRSTVYAARRPDRQTAVKTGW